MTEEMKYNLRSPVAQILYSPLSIVVSSHEGTLWSTSSLKATNPSQRDAHVSLMACMHMQEKGTRHSHSLRNIFLLLNSAWLLAALAQHTTAV